MKSFKTNLIYILIIALLLMILYETCKHKKGSTNFTSHSDTAVQLNYIYYKDTSKSKPIYVKGGRDRILETRVEYMPSGDYNELVKQFQSLKETLLSKNIYIDSLMLDSLGWVKITDTLQRNAILGRVFEKNIRIPIKTVTITNTVQAPPRRQVYVGGSVYATPFSTSSNNVFGRNTQSIITNVSGEMLYKDKQDRIFGAGVQWNGKDVNYGVSSYIKLSFKKKNQ
jgi:hypothetical protein